MLRKYTLSRFLVTKKYIELLGNFEIIYKFKKKGRNAKAHCFLITKVEGHTVKYSEIGILVMGAELNHR